MARRKILLVEGPDDGHVVRNLCGSRGGPWIDDIVTHDGVNALLEAFPRRIMASAGEHIIGVVLDADLNAATRWQAITDRLSVKGYENLPKQPAPDGTIIEPPPASLLSRFGVWLMPDNRTNGVLEDFLRFLVPSGSQLFEHVQASVASIPTREVRFATAMLPKVLIHTWLAWQADPGNPFGTAIKARYLEPEVPQVDTFVGWLKRLYTEGETAEQTV